MRIKQSITLDATTDQIVAALLSEELAAKRMKLLSIEDFQHKAEGNVAVTHAHVSADQMPPKARSLARNGVSAILTTTASGNIVENSLKAHGLPVSIVWTVTINEGTPTVANIDGELKVKIPIIGARVEAAAIERIDRLVAKEAQLIAEVISDQE